MARNGVFYKCGDGTIDFGLRYDPLSGLRAGAEQTDTSCKLPDCSLISYSANLAETHYNELSKHTTGKGWSTQSFRDWDHQRCG